MNAFKNSNRQLNIKSIIFYAVCAVFCISSCVLFFCTNVTHTVALEQEIRCGIEEHTHNDSCYNGDFLICDKSAHTHNGNCYIVLLRENNINNILTLLGNNESHSLENVITDTVSSALIFNANINSAENVESTDAVSTMSLSPDTVAKLNDTISDDEKLPNIVLNENINTANTLDADGTQDNVSSVALDIEETPVSTEKNANVYIYLDGKWTCIGNISFDTTYSWWQRNYTASISTQSLLTLVNDTLGTNFTRNSFSLSISSSLDGTYSRYALSNNTTTIGASQSSSDISKARYMRLVPVSASSAETNFAFYTVRYIYPDGSMEEKIVPTGTAIILPDGRYTWKSGNSVYEAAESVTITDTTTFTAEIIPIENINISYNVNFPTVSGVTVSTKPTLAGLTATTITDKYAQGSSATLRNVSQQSVEGKVNGNNTGLSRVVQFKGWRVGDTDTIIQPNTTLIWEELLQYADETEFTLTGVWDYSPLQTASFFIRFDSVAVDTDGNITGQDSNKYTKEIFSAYVGGVDTSLGTSSLQNKYGIADTTSDNSFEADQEIRALYGERADGVWLSAFPNDDYVFENLVQYANTGYLSVDGVAVKAEDLNNKEYAIRWYVFKSQDDAWHIDGKLVKKEGLIHVYKTFAGNKELISEAKIDFYIDATDITAGTNTVLTLDNRKSYNAKTDTYMWEIANVDYGEYWEITEHPHLFADPGVDFGVYSEYSVMDAHGDQSINGTGTSLSVKGMTYALDEGTDEVLRTEFTNIYNKNNSIVIKKQDSLTGVSIGGATFQLLQNGKALKFNYNSETDSYEHDDTSGTQTVLSGSSNGYFEISIEDFSYDKGPITIREMSAPTGYSPIGDIKIGYTDDGTIGILSGNSEMIKYMNGILIVGNSTDSMSVTAKKSWDCPKNEWQDVNVQLLANGKLVTTVIASVQPHVTLNTANNWQYTWENLPVYVNGEKIEWSIKETQIGTEAAKADGSFVNWLVSYELPVHSTDSLGNENVLLTVTNTTKRVMLRLTKTDFNNSLQLSGATFVLEGVDADGNVLASEVVKTSTTGDNGTLIFDNLKCGVRYRLTEQKAPEGYIKTDEYIYFTINEDGSVSVEDNFYAEAGSTAYNIIVRNASGVPLPESGSVGTGMFYTIGLLLIMAAAGIYISTFRKRRCQH